MDFEKYKKIELTRLQESIEFFSNKGREERELCNVTEFLKILGIDFTKSELSQPPDDPPDVIFRDAEFEVTELIDVNRRRHKELKERLKRLEAAKSYSDILESGLKQTKLTSEELLRKLENRLIAEKIYSNDVKAKTDALVYVNLVENYFDKEDISTLATPDKSPLKQWRSISLLFNGEIACVLFASASAPSFIRSVAGKVIRLKQEP